MPGLSYIDIAVLAACVVLIFWLGIHAHEGADTPFFWLVAPVYRRLRYVTLGNFFQERSGSLLLGGHASPFSCPNYRQMSPGRKYGIRITIRGLAS
jgi:hypothetical protein